MNSRDVSEENFEIYDSEPSTIVKTSQLAGIMSVSNASSRK